MSDLRSNADEIEILTGMQVIRRRPAMYVGSPDDVGLDVNRLLSEALCLSLENSLAGCATQILVKLHDDGCVTVSDDGPGMDFSSPGFIHSIFTQLHACRAAKVHDRAASLCLAGIVVTNALSCELTYETEFDGVRWSTSYKRGELCLPPTRHEAVKEQFQRLVFRPDIEVFSEPIGFEGFLRLIQAAAAGTRPFMERVDFGNVPIIVEDANTNETHLLNSAP